MIQTFEIPGRMDGLNEYTAACRTHRQVGGKLKRKNQAMAERAIRAARLAPMRRRVDVELVWIEPNMRRDKDNIRFAAKFVLDALVATGVLADVDPDEAVRDWKGKGGRDRRRSTPEERREGRKAAVEEAFDALGDGSGTVAVKAIAEYMEVSEKTVRRRLKEHGGFSVEGSEAARK